MALPYTVFIRSTEHKHVYVSLGAAEFVLGLKTYYESVQTTEACEMYSLDLKHYDRLIVRRHLRTLDVLKNTVRARLQNRIQRMPVDRCALFRLLLQKLRVSWSVIGNIREEKTCLIIIDRLRPARKVVNRS